MSFSTNRMSSFTEIGADASLTLGLRTVTKETGLDDKIINDVYP